MPNHHRLATILGFTVLYALCFPAIKMGLAFAPPLRFGGLRALLAGLALFGVAHVRQEPLFPRHGSGPLLLALAMTSTTLALGAMFLSVGQTSAGLASVLGNMQPLFAVVLAALLLGERISPRAQVALMLGLAGVSLISYPALTDPATEGASGIAFALVASAASALGSVIAKRLGTQGYLLAVAAWQLTLGSIPLLALSLFLEREASVRWNSVFVGLLLFLALAGTAFATALWYWLLERHEVGQLSLFLFLTPLFGLSISMLLFGERVGELESLGVVLTIAGIGVLLRDYQGNGHPVD